MWRSIRIPNSHRPAVPLALLGLGLGLLLTASYSLAQDKTDQVRKEEEVDYFERWVNQDVVYIITDEERAVFSKLTTPEEKEQFIEQFWFRRDPDQKTSNNEFKEEHYRRIAYANEQFASGKPGWLTDRGRIYIIHGPPASIDESFGGAYERPMYEGGGSTSTFPFQLWHYNRIDGLGENIDLEFVDTTLTGDYKLAKDHWEKDAFANVPNIGLTLAEERGLATKRDRFIMDGGGQYYPLLALRSQDTAFARLERYAGVMRPSSLKHKELTELVNVDISYSSLPFRLHQDHFRLNEQHILVPVTVELPNRHLTFKEENGVQIARMSIYGIVTGVDRTIEKEFEDDVITSFRPEQLEKGLQGTSMYQKILVLDQGKRYKIDLVVKDEEGQKVGVVSRPLNVPRYTQDELEISSILLSQSVQKLDNVPEADEMFVIGDMKIRPSLDNVFTTDRDMVAYFQLYNAGVDQSTQLPSIKVRYRLFRDGKPLVEIVDEEGESIHFFSSQRLVLLRQFSPMSLGMGKYRLLVEVQDRITNYLASVSTEFELTPASPPPDQTSQNLQ